MSILSRARWWTSVTLFLALVVCFALSSAVFAVGPADPPLQISSDPYTNSTSQHQTEVEPDSYSYGSTIVAAIQVGRFTDGGASNVGWETSTDNGTTWKNGFLPNTTVYATPSGPYERLSDPSVTYDAAHQRWIIASLAISNASGSPVGAAVIVSFSSDGGLTWNPPVEVANANGGFIDREPAASRGTSSPSG